MSNRSNHPTGGGDREFDSIDTEKISGAIFPAIAGNFDSVKRALSDANQNGGTVLVPPGTYQWDERLVIRSDVDFHASPGATFERAADIDAMLINGDSDDSFSGYAGESNISVVGGTWDGKNSTYTTNVTLLAFGHAESITVKDATFKNVNTWHLTELNAVRDGNVINCTFKDFPASAKEMLQIDMMAGGGPFPWFGAYDDTPCDDITVERCRFENGTIGIGSHTSVAGEYHDDVTVRNNKFLDLTESSIETLNYRRFTVDNNDFENVEKVYIGSDQSGADKVRITDNDYQGGVNANRFVQVDGTTAAINDGQATGNTVDGAGSHAFGIDFCNDWVVRDNIIKNSSGGEGVYVYSTSDVSVVDNRITGAGTDILLGNGGGTTSDFVVRGNRVESIIQAQSNAADGLIADNIVDGGVTIDGAATNVTKHDNIEGGSYVA